MLGFWEELKREVRSGIVVVFWATTTLLLALTGPFGSYHTSSLGLRLAVCVQVMTPLFVLGVMIRVGVRLLVGAHGWTNILSTAFVAVVVLAPIAHGLLLVVVPPGKIQFPDLADIAFMVASISFAFSSLRRIMPLHAPETAEAAKDARARILERVDPDLRGDLWAISVRDHYVEVFTSSGSAKVLLRLSDAISETEPVEGAQVHRSHWVAWSAVEAVERDGVKLFLRLAHGMRVPVSKNHRDKLEQRGLI